MSMHRPNGGDYGQKWFCDAGTGEVVEGMRRIIGGRLQTAVRKLHVFERIDPDVLSAVVQEKFSRALDKVIPTVMRAIDREIDDHVAQAEEDRAYGDERYDEGYEEGKRDGYSEGEDYGRECAEEYFDLEKAIDLILSDVDNAGLRPHDAVDGPVFGLGRRDTKSPVVSCPACHSDLVIVGAEIRCSTCQRTITLTAGE